MVLSKKSKDLRDEMRGVLATLAKDKALSSHQSADARVRAAAIVLQDIAIEESAPA